MPFRIADHSGLAVIKVFGVGGGGGNAVNSMVRSKLQGVEFISANTDKQALNDSLADVVMQIGPGITKGLGAGAKPDIGKHAALESMEEIKASVAESDLVFVAAGLGGGTGTGAAPVVARIAKEAGALVVGVVTKPFNVEGTVRVRNADLGWKELNEEVDTIITVPNDRLLALAEKRGPMAEMLLHADSVLLHAVKGISDLVNTAGIINVDFADLRTIMKEKGPAIMGVGRASGENRAMEAAQKAIDNQLIEDTGVDGARGLLINVAATPDTLDLMEFDEAAKFIQSKVDDEANIVLGAIEDDTLGDEMVITVIATGIGGEIVDAVGTSAPIVENSRPVGKDKIVDFSADKMKYAQPATKNEPPKDIFPRSNFESMDSSAKKQNLDKLTETTNRLGSKSSVGWNTEQLETPTYLRIKAN